MFNPDLSNRVTGHGDVTHVARDADVGAVDFTSGNGDFDAQLDTDRSHFEVVIVLNLQTTVSGKCNAFG